MCLGIPGKVIEIHKTEDVDEFPMGRVDFGGVCKYICLAYTPEVKPGDYVIVHVGFAISPIDASEARQVFDYLQEIDELGELEELENR